MPAWLHLMAESLRPLLVAGLVFTVPLTLASFAIGLLLAFGAALTRLFGPRWAQAVVRFYIWLFRGSPLLVQLFVIFYGLPNVGIVLDPLTAAVIGFSLNVGAYNAEVIRGVIESMPKGQWEAAYSMSMTRAQALRRAILPQAARIAIAPTVGFGVQAVKDTALVSIIGFTELTKVGIAISNATFRPFVVYGLVALIYFALCYPLTRYARTLQRRWHAAR